MATIRTLVTKLVLDSRSALNGLKAYDRAWKTVAKSVEQSAAVVEKAAARAMVALGGVAAGASSVRASAGASRSGGGGGGGGARPVRNESPVIDRIVRDGAREAAKREREQAQRDKAAARTAEQRAKAHGSGERAAGISAARQGGLVTGSATINTATAALGRFATASDKAKAKVADFDAQVQRNRKDMADLRAQIVKTGDADGTLAARMQGLAVATGQASSKLAGARRELRAIDGGLIDAIKGATNLSGRFDALKVAAGNLLSGAVSRGVRGVSDVLVGSSKAAMDFEKALVDVAKVAQDADLTSGGLLDPKIKAGIKDVSKALGVMPTEVAELTAQITAAFSGKTDIVALASDVTKIGVAWDITGKQAGEYFKQTSAGLQLNADETKALFGSINELGNRLGIKSSEIAEAMTRSAGVLKGANISGETGAALNATLIKAGASAEVAATGVRTFIARLGAGEAATDKQIAAFNALGLSAKDVAKNLASGDAAKAEGQIKEVVGALVEMGKEAPEKRLATLIQLFGSESIGSIGAAASAVDTLAGAFDIAGNKAAALTSVQAEYDRVSNTTAARVEKLKANIGVLAIEFGEQLLPYIDKVVAFLTSDEGKEWGANAVKTASEAVSGLATVLGAVGGALGFLIDQIGGVGTAAAGLGLVVAAMAGPWGIAGAAAAAALAGMVMGMGKVLGMIPGVRSAIEGLISPVAEAIGKEFAAKNRATDDAAMEAAATGPGGRAYGYGAAPMGSGPKPVMGGANAADSEARFAELAEMKRAGKALTPSQKKELRGLSKALDKAVPNKAGKGHKATKMDRQLAAMDPSLRGLLVQGGEEDAGGDLKVHDDVLSKGAFGASLRGRGLEAPGGMDRSGPGPNIHTTNIFNEFKVEQRIDARGQDRTAAQNISSASESMAQRVNQVQFVGAERLVAMRNGGGRLAG